jgi:hypothetical protein
MAGYITSNARVYVFEPCTSLGVVSTALAVVVDVAASVIESTYYITILLENGKLNAWHLRW